LAKGAAVVAVGRLKQRSYETNSGEKRTSIELEIDEIGPSLRYATAQVTRAASTRGAQGASARQGSSGGDSWGAPAPTAQAGAQQPDVWDVPAALDSDLPF